MIRWADLEARYQGRDAFIAKLLGIFTTAHGSFAVQMREFTATGNSSDVARLAHSLKSSAGNIMAMELMDLALRTEQAARRSAPEAMELALQLSDELEATLLESEARQPPQG